MTAELSPQALDHMSQICRERSARGVATKTDWQRFAEIDPQRAYRELLDYLKVSGNDFATNPYDTASRPPRSGAVVGFVAGVIFLILWWLFVDYLHREVFTSDLAARFISISQYVVALMLPVFAWVGWRIDVRRDRSHNTGPSASAPLEDASWDDLLSLFDATRKAGGTRMY